MNKGKVYICHHVDTEGPLLEDRRELFKRLKLIFGIDLDATEENLNKLRNGQINVDQKILPELLKVIDPHTINFKKTWQEIENMLDVIMSKKFRNEIPVQRNRTRNEFENKTLIFHSQKINR